MQVGKVGSPLTAGFFRRTEGVWNFQRFESLVSLLNQQLSCSPTVDSVIGVAKGRVMSNTYIEQLIHAATTFYRNGWMVGTSGNLSARREDDSFWITASGRSKGTLTPADFVRVSLSGEIVESTEGARPSAETSIHQVIYTRFPRARAIYHVHSVEGNLVSAFNDADEIELPPLEMLKGFHVMEDQPKVSIPVFKNHSDVARIAKEIHARFQAEQFRLPALMIRRHGVTVWSETQEETLNRVELIEFLFKYMVLARQLKLT